MNGGDFLAILPLLATTGAAVALMLAIAFWRSHSLAAGITMAGLVVAFGTLWDSALLTPRQVTPLLIVDRYALFFMGLLIVSAAAVTVLAYRYFEDHEGHAEEFYLLLLIATLGCEVLVSSSHFVSFFLGLEVLSVSLYGMIGYLTERKHPLEAALKYLVLAAASSAFLLFGMALIYADLGTMEFARIGVLIRGSANAALIRTGMTLLITGFGFKLALVPFHLWTPDVYEGAPAPVTAFIATASKSAMFALLLRYFFTANAQYTVFLVFAIIAVASMLTGNLLALRQSNVKRILAYSSIAHLGYALVAFLAGGAMAAEAVTFYLVAYTITTLGAFGVITVLSRTERDADDIEDYRGLFWQRPVIAAVFTTMLLSLAGIPVTAGFVAKFYVIAAGATAASWGLIIVLAVGSAIGLFYYLRIVAAMYSTRVEEAPLAERIPVAGGVLLGALTVALVWLGVYPTPLVNMIRSIGTQ